MKISMHNASVGVYTKLLQNLLGMLDKCEKWVTEKKIDPNAILQARLAPDMFTFTRQIQIMTDMAKGTAARLAGVEPPRYEDNETSLAEIKARVSKTIDYLNGLDAKAFEASEDRTITLTLGPPTARQEHKFEGLAYLHGFGTPNVYFHYSMAYALLRHNGLEIGKRDFV
jgi:uncharacterized protein